MATKHPFPTFSVTSPLIKGADVRVAQRLLKTNRHDIVFYEDKIDGEYGPYTGAAAHKAKYLLGYPRNKINSSFGATLRNYLVTKDHPAYKELPLAYRTRALARRREERKQNVLKDSLELARTQIGYREQSGNRTKYGEWYGWHGWGAPWCAVFVSWCISHSGGKFHWAYCPYIVENARNGEEKTWVTNNPQPGHMVCYDWNYDGTFDHIGFFDKWIDRDAGTFATIEGNTSSGNAGSQSNGGGVYARSRSTRTARVVFIGWEK